MIAHELELSRAETCLDKRRFLSVIPATDLIFYGLLSFFCALQY
jgi:hypothetical protein